MKSSQRAPLVVISFLNLIVFLNRGISADMAQDPPESPRVDSVEMLSPQPHEFDSNVIWYDDFDDEASQSLYPETSGSTTADVHFGLSGRSLRMHYPKGEQGTGNRKVFFGDSPTYQSQAVRPGETFDDVYWRIYVKHPHDWQGGGPAKLSRATSLVFPDWRQAMIAHVWSSGESLTLDPATGVQGDAVVTTKYNDFKNLEWLGNRPASRFKLHGADGAGRWVCVEARARLNTPGERDGINQLWIDGHLEAERVGLDWRGSFMGRGINAVFLEAYWNEGSPVDQSRWIDNFVVSTEPIGPVTCPRNPWLVKTPYRGPADQGAWRAQVALAADVQSIVWRSDHLDSSRRILVSQRDGTFVGPLAEQDKLAADARYVCRVSQQSSQGVWSEWSSWHQPFRTASSGTQQTDAKSGRP